MTRRGLTLLALLAISHAVAVCAQSDKTYQWDSSMTGVFDKFLSDLNSTLYQVKEDLHHKNISKPMYRRHLSGYNQTALPSKLEDVKMYFTDALTNLKTKIDEDKNAIFAAAQLSQEKIGNISEALKEKFIVHVNSTWLTPNTMMSEVLGKDFKDFFPTSWGNVSDWGKLANMDFKSSMGDFVDAVSLGNITKTQSLGELYASLQNVIGAFCKSETITPSDKFPHACAGPAVTLQLVPKACTLDSITKVLSCTPAYLQLVKTPATCNSKYYSAFVYTGKQCAITGTIGVSKTAKLGGTKFSVLLSDTKLG